jgi:hypothetical protein
MGWRCFEFRGLVRETQGVRDPVRSIDRQLSNYYGQAMKVRDVIRAIERNGWCLERTNTDNLKIQLSQRRGKAATFEGDRYNGRSESLPTTRRSRVEPAAWLRGKAASRRTPKRKRPD